MKTKVWLNLDPQKVDVSYLYKKFDEIGCDFEAEVIPDNNPELLIKKVKNTPKKYPRKAGTPAKEPIV